MGSIMEGAPRLLPCTEGTCFSPLIRREREREQDLSMSRRLTGDRRGMVTAKRIQKHEVWDTLSSIPCRSFRRVYLGPCQLAKKT